MTLFAQPGTRNPEPGTSLFPQPGTAPFPRPDLRDVWALATWGVRVPPLDFARGKDPARRRACRENFLRFCSAYAPEIFWDPNEFHLEFAAELETLLLTRAQGLLLKALAAPRGVGKTTVVLLFILWAAFYGHCRFAIILCGNAPHADERMAGLKGMVLTNERLYEDFPELCGPVRAFGGDARAAAGATPDYPWSKDLIRLANGVFIASYGMDSGIAGRLKNFARPDLILCDDCETLDIARSKADSERLRARLNQEVMELPGPRTPALLVWICTLKLKGCLSDQLTDRAANPEWRGSRYRGLLAPPAREDAWAYFRELVKPGAGAVCPQDLAEPGPEWTGEKTMQRLGIPTKEFEVLTAESRKALQFYAAHRDAMDAAAECLDPQLLPLHRIQYKRALLGDPAWLCEVQQDPPADAGIKDLQLEMDLLARRAVGPARGVVPAWAAFLTATLDMGRSRCHWQIDAWDALARTSCLIDQGWQDTQLEKGGEYRMTDDESTRAVMVQTAIQFALEERAKAFAQGWPREATGERLFPAVVGVDCGGTAERFAWYETVLRFCAKYPLWLPLKGSDWKERTADRAMGRNWICEAQGNPGRRHDCNADEYKTRVFQALAAPVWKVEGIELLEGTRFFHRDCPREYCRHLIAEKYVEIVKPEAPSGKEFKVGWNHITNIPNHWWDTSWMAYALTDIVKFRRTGTKPKYGVVGRAFS